MSFYQKGTSLKSRIDSVNEMIKMQIKVLTAFVNPKRGPVTTTSSNNIKFDDVSEYLDDICENAGSSLDKLKVKGAEISNIVVKKNLLVDITNQDVVSRDDDSKKPQLYFDPRPDNSEVYRPINERLPSFPSFRTNTTRAPRFRRQYWPRELTREPSSRRLRT